MSSFSTLTTVHFFCICFFIVLLRYDISSIARKTGISSATQLAKLVPKGEKGEREEPDIEWLEKLVDF